MNDKEFCIDCGMELETICKEGEVIGAGDAWTRTTLKSDGKFHFEGFVCDNCHIKGGKNDN